MPEPLIIQIRGDRTPWRTAIAEAKRDARSLADEQVAQAKRAGQATQATTAGEVRERKRAADVAVREFNRVANEAMKSAAVARRESERGAAVAQREAKRSGDAIAREAKRGADAQMKADKAAFDARFVSLGSLESAGARFTAKRIADENRAAAAVAKATKQAISDDQVAFQARNRFVQQGNKARVDAAVKAMHAEKEANESGKLGAEGLGEAFGAIGASVAIFGTVARSVIGPIAKMWEDMRNAIYEAAKNIGDVREQLLELAALKGRLGDTTTEIREQAVFRAQTLQGADAARAFQGQFLNVGNANVAAGLISQPEFNKAMVQAGKFQAAEGGDAATHGKLAGIIPALVGKKGITAEEVGATEQKFFNIMQMGGFDFTSGANQLIDKQGLVTSGQFKDPARMVATLSALSQGSSPLEAGTHLQHLVEGTTGAFDRVKKGKIDGETMTQSAYLKGLGAAPGMDPLEMGKLIAADVNKARDAGGAAFDPTIYLQHKGYMNEHARGAILGLAGQMRSGQLGAFEARAASPTGLTAADMADPNFIPAEQRMDQFQNSPTAARRRGELAKHLGDFAQGSGSIEYYNQWQEQAFNLMRSRAPGKWTGDVSGWKNDRLYGGKETITRTMLDTLTEEAKKKGMNVPGDTYGGKAALFNYDFGPAGKFNSGDLDLGSEYSRGDKIADIASKLGVNLDKALMERLVKLNEEQTENSRKLLQKMGAAPIPPVLNPAGPAAPMNRP